MPLAETKRFENTPMSLLHAHVTVWCWHGRREASRNLRYGPGSPFNLMPVLFVCVVISPGASLRSGGFTDVEPRPIDHDNQVGVIMVKVDCAENCMVLERQGWRCVGWAIPHWKRELPQVLRNRKSKRFGWTSRGSA